MLVIAALLALLVGISLGLLGGGGSILTVPILRYVLGLEGHAAIALSLLVVGVTSVFGLIAHARRGRVRWRTGLLFGAAGMGGAFAAGRVAHLIPAGVLLLGFGLMMFGTALAMLRPRCGTASPTAAPGSLPVVKVLLEGLAVGAATGLVGAGGGFLVVPALVLLGHLPMDVAVGTSLLVIALKSLAGFAGYLGHVTLDVRLAIVLSGAAIGGSLLGGVLAARVTPQTLRQAFGWFVVAMAFFILTQELPPLLGAEPRPALALAVSVATTAALALARRWWRRRGGLGAPAAPHRGPSSRPPPGTPSCSPSGH